MKGFIPVDIFFKTDDEALRLAACARLAGQQALLDAGVYASTTGGLFSALGNLALATPGDPSPIVPGFTNFQAALLAGSATYVLLPPGLSFVPFYHFAGGTFDAMGVPTGLSYTAVPAWFHFETGAAPFEPTQILLDGEAILCNETDVPFDDHLAQVTVPVLYIGAGGGFGEFGIYSTTLLGSTDVTTLVVQLQPPSARALDIGHADIWNATNAEAFFWQPILNWIESH